MDFDSLKPEASRHFRKNAFESAANRFAAIKYISESGK
jgi:hypothetical protein